MKKYKRPINTWKRCSTSLDIQELQIETTLRFHFTPERIAITKKSDNTNAIEVAGGEKASSLLVERKLEQLW